MVQAKRGPYTSGATETPVRGLVLAGLFVCSLFPAPARAQEACPRAVSPYAMGGIADPVKIREVASGDVDRGGDPLRAGSRELAEGGCPSTDAVRLVPARIGATYRSAYPVDRNDGLLWSGRGVSSDVLAGFTAGQGAVRLTVAPTVAWQQNRDVRIVPGPADRSPFAYPYGPIDWPQRFGETSYATWGPGESSLDVAVGALDLRVASEDLWWGPAHRYPILLGNTAPGFPHVSVGTSRPVWIGIGFLRARLMWGRVDESKYFDADPTNDQRLLSGFFADYQPWFLPGLTLGGGLLYHLPWESATSHLFDVFTFPVTQQETSTGNALASVTARWVFPEVGFEAYMELAREDFWLNTEDLITEPDHSLGHTFGFSKLLADGSFYLEGEWTSLLTHNLSGRGAPSFYEHSFNRVDIQGHTNRGQLLGSWIGTGADAQFLALTHRSDARQLGVWLERVRRDETTYERLFATNYGFRGHDLEWTVGLHGVEPWGPLRLDWNAGVSRRKNRSFLDLDGRHWSFLRETNLTLDLSAWWLPGVR